MLKYENKAIVTDERDSPEFVCAVCHGSYESWFFERETPSVCQCCLIKRLLAVDEEFLRRAVIYLGKHLMVLDPVADGERDRSYLKALNRTNRGFRAVFQEAKERHFAKIENAGGMVQ